MNRPRRIPANAQDVAVKSYVPGSQHQCCCGDPGCTDFEDRMAAMGIPLDELAEVEFALAVDATNSAIDAHCEQAEPGELTSRAQIEAAAEAAGFASGRRGPIVVTYERYEP